MATINMKPQKPNIPVKILNAAEKVLLEKGFRLASIDEISDLAGVTKRTIYKYFPSKLSILIYMVDSQLSKLKKELSNVMKNKSSESGSNDVEKSLKVLFNFTLENEKFMKLYWMLDSVEFEGEIPEELIAHIDKLTEQTFEINRTLINKTIGENKIANTDPNLLMHLLSAINKGIFIHTNKEKRLAIADIKPQELFELLMFILENGLFTEDKKGGTAQ
jgi:AcrR family transcriptional regulator